MHSDNEMVNLRSVIETLCYMVDDDSDGVEEVMQLPSIDIVRCAECKCWSYSDLIESHNRCERTFKLTKADDFCSRGERREP